MQSFIINSKQVVFEKNKEFVFKIPVLFKPIECEFNIDNQISNFIENHIITFGLKSTNSSSIIYVSIQLNAPITKQNLYNINSELSEEYLLISCISNQTFTASLSIIRNKIG